MGFVKDVYSYSQSVRLRDMVIKDVFTSERKDSSVSPTLNMAPPGDRLLAGMLDLLFHTPIFTLLTSLVVYRLNLLKITNSSTSEKMAVFAQIAWIVLVGSVILQGIYFKLWKKTPGMRLMKLELRSVNATELTWGQCLLRSAVWSLQLFLFGLPLLEIFSHPKRQAVHDRISESEIITLKSKGAPTPLASEKATVQFVFMTALMLTLGWFTALFSTTQKRVQDGTMALAEWRENSRLCGQVDEIGTYSNVDLSDISRRLDFATSLYFLEQVDEDCYRQEVDFALNRENPGPLVWVGRALLSGINTKERQQYMAQACKASAHWCLKSIFKEKAPLHEGKKLLDSVKQKDFTERELAYKTSVLILLNRMGASTEAEKIISSLQSKGVRATGLVAEQLRTISRSRPEHIPVLLDTLKSVMVEKDYLRLNSEICLQQLEAGCGGKVPECEVMTSLLPSYKDSMEDLVVSRALFKTSVCKKDLAENMEYWTLLENQGLQKLLRISVLLEKNNNEMQALTKLRNFVKDESQKIELRLDALQLLLSRSNYSDDWNLASYLWERLDWTQSSFLSASEWLIRQGTQAGKVELISGMSETFSAVPGLKIDLGLMKQKVKERLPAQIRGVSE